MNILPLHPPPPPPLKQKKKQKNPQQKSQPHSLKLKRIPSTLPIMVQKMSDEQKKERKLTKEKEN